jgi:hypothetical protein
VSTIATFLVDGALDQAHHAPNTILIALPLALVFDAEQGNPFAFAQ